jgi:hypothetical protein
MKIQPTTPAFRSAVGFFFLAASFAFDILGDKSSSHATFAVAVVFFFFALQAAKERS